MGLTGPSETQGLFGGLACQRKALPVPHINGDGLFPKLVSVALTFKTAELNVGV